jgi:hypothetical protein
LAATSLGEVVVLNVVVVVRLKFLDTTQAQKLAPANGDKQKTRST